MEAIHREPEPKKPDDNISRQLRRQMERKLKRIQIIPDHTSLTATTGLRIFIEVFTRIGGLTVLNFQQI